VTVDPAIGDAKLIPSWVGERNPDVEKQLDLPEHTQWLEVEIGGATYAYRVTVQAMRDGDPVGPATVPVACECNSQELLELVDTEIAKGIAALESNPPEPLEPKLEPEPEPKPTPVREPDEEPKASKRITGLGIGGIVTASFGVLAAGAGVAMVVIKEQPIEPETFLVRDYRPLGYASLSVGATALIAGVTMLVVDLTRCKRSAEARGCSQADVAVRGGAPRRRIAPSITLTKEEVGIFFQGRF